MTRRFNGWQRLWVLASALLFAMTIALVGVLWPQRESGMLTDLRSPQCKVWREIPEGFFPEKYPEMNEACYSIQSFLYYQRVDIRSEKDYSAYLLRARVKTILVGLASWGGVALVIYILGWSIGWVAKGFSKTT